MATETHIYALCTCALCLLLFTTVESALQIDPFLTNKANFRKAKMNVSSSITMNYEQKTMNYANKNKANTKPIKANTKPIQSQSKPIKCQNKPNQTQFLPYPNPPDYLSQPSAAPRSQ